MTADLEKWLNAIKRLPENGKEQSQLIKVFPSVLEYIYENRWQGAACRTTTAIFTVLLRELDIPAQPFLGECAIGDAFFDNSWVEIRGNIYDVAIANPVLLERQVPPVFAGKSVDGFGPAQIRYGVASNQGLDLEAQLIRNTPFCQYMDNFSEYRQGLWGVAKDIGKRAGLKLNVEKMRKKHADVQWQVRA